MTVRLIFASTVTLALNVADPLVVGQYGKAAFDSVGPLLLIGCAEVGPDLLRALTAAGRLGKTKSDDTKRMDAPFADEPTAVGQTMSEVPEEDTKPNCVPSDGYYRTPIRQNGADRPTADSTCSRRQESDLGTLAGIITAGTPVDGALVAHTIAL